jgi:hypothetical protein
MEMRGGIIWERILPRCSRTGHVQGRDTSKVVMRAFSAFCSHAYDIRSGGKSALILITNTNVCLSNSLSADQ